MNNNRGLPNTNYEAVTFDEIKDKLINRAKTYYPDTYKDFSKSSFGSLMFDLVSMVSEQLNFYAQFVANESFVEFARTAYGLQAAANRADLSLSDSAPAAPVRMTFSYTAAEGQNTPALRGGFWMLAGATCTGPGGAKVQTMEDTFVNPAAEIPTTTRFSIDGTRSLEFSVEKDVIARAGMVKRFTVEVGDYTHFLRIEIPDITATEVIDCIDSEGHKYYEVGNLSHTRILADVESKDPDTGQSLTIMVDKPVPRRFQVIEESGKKFLLFGYGSQGSLTVDDENILASPLQLTTQKEGYGYVIDNSVVPERHLTSDKYGVPPQNTTLTITYRANTSENSNIPIGGIDTVESAEIVFENEEEIDQETKDFIRNSISVTNVEPFNGLVRFQSTREIAIQCRAALGAQGRAVTEKDFEAMSYIMPNRYGKIRKVSASKNTQGLRRSLDLYCISQGSDEKLQKASSVLKENLKKWLGSVKMMSDTIDIYDAEILNLGMHIDVTIKSKQDLNSALPRIREFLHQKLNLTTPEIGQPFSIGEIERILNLMPMIESVNRVQLNVKNTAAHSDVRYDIAPNLSADGSSLYVPRNFIWEVKRPLDITGIAK